MGHLFRLQKAYGSPLQITKSIWVTSSDYKNAQPDPLRDSAHNFVTEINTNNMEDITRFCNVYVDLDFLVCYYLLLTLSMPNVIKITLLNAN